MIKSFHEKPTENKKYQISTLKTILYIYIYIYIHIYIEKMEDNKKRWQEYTEEPDKKDLHFPVNHDGMITHLEPDILECEVKWTLESITTNKASGSDRIPVELFHILKNDGMKVQHSICQQILKTRQWPQD